LAVLFAIGAGLGLTLYLSGFGFAGAYRAFLVERRADGVRAQILLLALGSLVFAPLLARGELLGQGLGGAVAPVGWSVAVGAFLFGIGMQLGDGCASGTLYIVGGGSRRMLVTLAGFVAGSLAATYHMEFWWRLPRFGSVSLADALGWGGALALQLAVLAGLYALVRSLERPPSRARVGSRAWPLWAGAAALVGLNAATLAVAGHPWSIAWGYTLWGGKLARSAGLDLSGVPFWSGGFPGAALDASVLADETSLMNIGILLGAALAAAWLGRAGSALVLRPGPVAASLIGGLLMGYGARLAFGCNIGAFFSGVSSFSLHGWLWIATALPGTWLGIHLRPWFGLSGYAAPSAGRARADGRPAGRA
jgi:uncharacterized membrane protein YedE/YeeE